MKTSFNGNIARMIARRAFAETKESGATTPAERKLVMLTLIAADMDDIQADIIAACEEICHH